MNKFGRDLTWVGVIKVGVISVGLITVVWCTLPIFGVNSRHRYPATPICANSISVSSFANIDHSSPSGEDNKRAPAVFSY